MNHRLALAVLLLPIAGCVVAPPPPPPPPAYGYAPQAYPAGPQDFSYPGYAYNDGSPTLVVGNVTWPLIFYGGAWGYWDGYHRWHVAPGPVGHWLSVRHPGGVGYHPYGGGTFGRPGGFRGAYGPPPGAGRPGAAAYHPAANRPAPQQRHREDEHR